MAYVHCTCMFLSEIFFLAKEFSFLWHLMFVFFSGNRARKVKQGHHHHLRLYVRYAVSVYSLHYRVFDNNYCHSEVLFCYFLQIFEQEFLINYNLKLLSDSDKKTNFSIVMKWTLKTIGNTIKSLLNKLGTEEQKNIKFLFVCHCWTKWFVYTSTDRIFIDKTLQELQFTNFILTLIQFNVNEI